MLTLFLVFHLVGQKLCYLGMGGFNRAFIDGDRWFPRVAFCGFTLTAFPKFVVLVCFYSLGVVCPIKPSFGNTFSLNSVFLGSVSSLHSHRSNSRWIVWEMFVLFQIRLKLAESSRKTACSHWDCTSICLRQKKKIKLWIQEIQNSVSSFFFFFWNDPTCWQLPSTRNKH